MLRDLRHAVRVLLQARGWTAVVVLSLALGIGANAALFSGANALLLRTIPVKDPDSLVRLRFYGRNQMSNSSSDYGFGAKTRSGENIRSTVSYPMYQAYRASNTTMQDLTACAPAGRVNVVDGVVFVRAAQLQPHLTAGPPHSRFE